VLAHRLLLEERCVGNTSARNNGHGVTLVENICELVVFCLLVVFTASNVVTMIDCFSPSIVCVCFPICTHTHTHTHSLPKRPSEQSARLPRSKGRTAPCPTGFVCEPTTLSSGTPSVATGAAPSWDSRSKALFRYSLESIIHCGIGVGQ